MLVTKTIKIPYSKSQVFDLVDDVASYPEFLPWCSSTSVLKRDTISVQASMTFVYAGVSYTVTTMNKLHKPSEIVMQLCCGPFKSLVGSWRFTDLGNNHTKATLLLEFTMNNKMLELALRAMLPVILTKVVESFCTRAKNLYA